MTSRTTDLPTSLSTGYDLLPLPTPTQFELDRNLPSPTRRITVDELVRVVHEHHEDEDLGGRERSEVDKELNRGRREDVGKVRVYGRVLQYLPDRGILLLNDPDTPSVILDGPASSLPSRSRSTSTSKSPSSWLALLTSSPWIAVSCSILTSHLPHPPLHTSPAPSSSTISHGDEVPWKSLQNMPRDLDGMQEYTLGRYPAGSGRPQSSGSRIGPGSNAGRMMDQGRPRTLGPVRLERGEAVCVVGWIERLSETFDRESSVSRRHVRDGDKADDGRETVRIRTDKHGWEQVEKRGWVVDAIQIMNVPAYEPGVPHQPPMDGGDADITLGGTRSRTNTKDNGWEKRKGLEGYD